MFQQITEDEYKNGVAEIMKKAQEEQNIVEQSKDEQIAALEQENAALLFQILTGEEYANV